MTAVGDWSTYQLTEFLVAVSSYTDRDAALRGAVERAAEALEAEVGAVVDGSTVLAHVGFPRSAVPADLVVAAAAGAVSSMQFPILGPVEVAVVPVEGQVRYQLVLGRAGTDRFDATEVNLLRAMGRVLGQTLRVLATLEEEQSLREAGERYGRERDELLATITERQQLLERLSRIQRSISHRAPLQEVLDAITSGAQELIGDEIVGLRLVDPEDPAYFELVSICGVNDDMRAALARGPVGLGAGGRAIVENRLVIINDYGSAPDGVPSLQADQLAAAMAAPVHENGVAIGSLAIATYASGRTYSADEQEALLAFAEHASLALTDARTVDAMREAQRTKDLFLAMVSHELKTPLTVIMGTLRTLQKHGPALPPETHDLMLEAAFGRGRELERLIDRLLRGARAELAGARQVVAVPDLISAAISGFEQVRRVVVTEISDDRVEVDSAAVQDAVGILVENAISHSPSDTAVVVSADIVNRELRIEISNVGELPPEVDRAMLFAPFQRGAAATSSGVGLGLYIAVRLAEAMDGRIDLEAAEGRVAFSLIIPAVSTPAAPDLVDSTVVDNTVVEMRRRATGS